MSEDPEYKLMETSSMDVEYYNGQVLYWYDVYQACMITDENELVPETSEMQRKKSAESRTGRHSSEEVAHW